MILLDTNVVSEIVRPTPDARVAAWMIAQPVPVLFTTAIAEAEIFKEIEIMAFGEKATGASRDCSSLFPC